MVLYFCHITLHHEASGTYSIVMDDRIIGQSASRFTVRTVGCQDVMSCVDRGPTRCVGKTKTV